MRELHKEGVKCYKNQVALIMSKYGIVPKTCRKFKATTDSKHNHPVASNLLNRNFRIDEPDRVWVGDITYIWTREGWQYLSTVIDLFSKRVVAWSTDKRMKKDLVISSFKKAVKLRKPSKGLIFHSDRGSQYASLDFRIELKKVHAKQSMSRKGDCWDNAVAESFFKTIKTEMIYWNNFQTRDEANAKIFEYIEMFYNSRRLHSTLDYMSPNKFEEKFFA